MVFRVKDVLGLKIKEIKFNYTVENDFGLQEFTTFIKLSNNEIIQIPYFIDEYWNSNDVILINEYSKIQFFDNEILKIVGKSIVDFYFVFFENELNEQEKAIVEIEDGVYFTEKHFGPVGLTDVNLRILNKDEFNLLNLDIESEKGFELRSLKKVLRNNQNL